MYLNLSRSTYCYSFFDVIHLNISSRASILNPSSKFSKPTMIEPINTPVDAKLEGAAIARHMSAKQTSKLPSTLSSAPITISSPSLVLLLHRGMIRGAPWRLADWLIISHCLLQARSIVTSPRKLLLPSTMARYHLKLHRHKFTRKQYWK